ncbi:MAG: leucyl/phenylalanyl-tRNA--protein transferase [Planctomycetota bacterium]
MLVRAYLQGAFPMAEGTDGQVYWYSPDPRAIIPIRPNDPLGSFRVRRSLAKRVRNAGFEIAFDHQFEQVMRQCAAPRPGESGSWISPEITAAYCELHAHGLAHSVEAYRNGQLVGGLYGVSLGGAFFGESMFSREKDASQVCLVHLVERLQDRGFRLLDVQFRNDHLDKFGIVEIPRDRYLVLLDQAVERLVEW